MSYLVPIPLRTIIYPYISLTCHYMSSHSSLHMNEYSNWAFINLFSHSINNLNNGNVISLLIRNGINKKNNKHRYTIHNTQYTIHNTQCSILCLFVCSFVLYGTPIVPHVCTAHRRIRVRICIQNFP